MKVDATIADVVLTTATKTKTNSQQVLDVLDKYYAGVTHIIENEVPGVIKIDFFGKLIFSHSWKEKLNKIKQEKQKDETI